MNFRLPSAPFSKKTPLFNFFLLLSASALLFSCDQTPKQVKEPGIDPAIAVTCNGIGEVKLTDTYADLQKKFGAASLTEHENTKSGHYTTIWDKQPKRLDVYWKEKSAPYLHIAAIETQAPDAPYLAKGGLKIGMMMKEVQQINTGMPLTFVNPYAEDDAGLISTFNNGQLAKDNPCIGGYVDISKTGYVDPISLSKFRDEKMVDSSDPVLQDRLTVIFSSFRVVAK